MTGGAEETRTPDLLRAKEALSQLSYSPMCRNIIIAKGPTCNLPNFITLPNGSIWDSRYSAL